jgi:phosphatidyl-myo-inositol alpha-mannosyltransferase
MVSPYDLTVPGGVQSHVVHLARALTALGDEVTLVGPGTAAGGELSVGRSQKVPFNGSVAPIALWPTSYRRTVRALRDLEPDVIHVHEPLVPWVGVAAATSALAPVVGTFHAWSDTSRAYRLARPVGRRVLSHLAAAVAVSEAAAEYHAAALGVAARRFRIVPNGVDLARFDGARPLEGLHDPGVPTLAFVGRLEPRKGLEILIRAFTRLKADRPDLRLLVVGEGPERERCQALLPARLRADVVFLGRVDVEELPGCYAAADVYVSPALGGESFGIVLLEAMAAGRPVVASDLPGYRSVLRDGLQGCLVPPNDPVALATTLGTLLDNPALREAMAREGRRTVAAYDWPVVAATLREVYRSVV